MIKRILILILLVVLLAGAVLFILCRKNNVQPPDKALKPLASVPSRAVEPAVPVSNVRKQPDSSSASKVEGIPALVLSDAIKTLLASNTPFAIRSQIIKDLSRDLSADDVTALRNFLNAPPSTYPKMKPITLNSIKNDILEVLMDQRQLPEGLGQQVVDMFKDPSADYMWREYCLQFMAPFLERQIKSGAVPEPKDQNNPAAVEMAVVTGALYAALDDRGKDLAGTALLGLDRLAKKYKQFDRKAVSAKAVEIAEDTGASSRCRLTALRVAASAGSTDILPTARELAQNGQTDLLRGAAITTLGDFGAPEDIELLTTLSSSPNRQIAAAAQSALKRVKK